MYSMGQCQSPPGTASVLPSGSVCTSFSRCSHGTCTSGVPGKTRRRAGTSLATANPMFLRSPFSLREGELWQEGILAEVIPLVVAGVPGDDVAFRVRATPPSRMRANSLRRHDFRKRHGGSFLCAQWLRKAPYVASHCSVLHLQRSQIVFYARLALSLSRALSLTCGACG